MVKFRLGSEILKFEREFQIEEFRINPPRTMLRLPIPKIELYFLFSYSDFFQNISKIFCIGFTLLINHSLHIYSLDPTGKVENLF